MRTKVAKIEPTPTIIKLEFILLLNFNETFNPQNISFLISLINSFYSYSNEYENLKEDR